MSDRAAKGVVILLVTTTIFFPPSLAHREKKKINDAIAARSRPLRNRPSSRRALPSTNYEFSNILIVGAISNNHGLLKRFDLHDFYG